MIEPEDDRNPNAPVLGPIAPPLAASEHLTLSDAGPQPTLTEIWVCVDCFLQHHHPDHDEGDPWALYPDLLIGQVTDWSCDENDVDPEAGTRAFSWSPCEGCGSTLGGSRHRFALWGDDPRPV